MAELQGIDFKKSETGSLCFTIHELSDELRTAIRTYLSEICHGAAKASRKTTLYSYQQTLVDFFGKFDTKTADTQKGMVGELLTHVLFLQYEKDFRAASPHFNLEEDSIKKGFDLVLHHEGKSETWFVEVKSGECGGKTSIQKLGDLLSAAKVGLKSALDSERKMLWQNAINGANSVLKDGKFKEQIIDILEKYNENSVAGNSVSTDYNAILVGVCFSGNQAFATSTEFEVKHVTQKNMNEFRNLMSVALQKDTIQSVIDFLRSEIYNV